MVIVLSLRTAGFWKGSLAPSAADLGRRFVRKTLTIREIIDAQLCHCSSPKEVSKQKSSIRLERVAALDKLCSTGCARSRPGAREPL